MKILSILGARPQFIKSASISRLLQNVEIINEVVVHTGQHFDRDMSDLFFEQLELPQPKYNLGVGGGTHGQNTGRMIEKIEEILLNEKPNCILVYGDTDSTLAGAIAASKLHIPIVHIEAGLRSYNRRMPEEINRILTDHLAGLNFCPTVNAVENLVKEGIDTGSIFYVGDVMKDVSRLYKSRATKPQVLNEESISNFILLTFHRAENTSDLVKISRLFDELVKIKKTIIFPVHPRTRKLISDKLRIPDNVKIIPPVSYLDMLWLENNADIIITDSGGVQKEAYFASKYCITLRNETEWSELVKHDVNFLIGDNYSTLAYYIDLVEKKPKYPDIDLYGHGNAGEKIVEVIMENYG